MARQIVDIQGLIQSLPFTVNQIYKLVRDPRNPIPFRKCNKRSLSDFERVWKWFDALPGRDVDAKGGIVLPPFPSVAEAVRCAVKVQEQVKERNSELAD